MNAVDRMGHAEALHILKQNEEKFELHPTSITAHQMPTPYEREAIDVLVAKGFEFTQLEG